MTKENFERPLEGLKSYCWSQLLQEWGVAQDFRTTQIDFILKILMIVIS